MGLFLSDIYGGAELMGKPFDKTCIDICRRMELHKKNLIASEDGTLNVLFHFPGSISRPDFVGVRTGSFSKKERTLVVQVAFPGELISSSGFARHYLAFLKDALAEGKKYFDKKGIPFSLDDHLALAEKSVEGLTEAT